MQSLAIAEVASFEEQFRTFTPLIEKIVSQWRQGRDHHFAEDIRQTAWIACWRALETYDASRNKSLFNYTYCCASRAARDAVRSYRRCHHNVVSFEETLEEAKPDGNCLFFKLEIVEAEEAFDPTLEVLIEDEDLYWACKQLHPQDKMILTWFYGWEQTDAQIAARLEMQPAAVKKRRQRAVRRLREWLSETRGRVAGNQCRKSNRMSPESLNIPTVV
jgi:RNA polymerase sigma factor (sigma-70 family)